VRGDPDERIGPADGAAAGGRAEHSGDLVRGRINRRQQQFRSANPDTAGCRGDVATFILDDYLFNFFRLTDSVEFCNTAYGGGAYFGIFARYGASFAGRYNPSCNFQNELASVSRLQRGDLISNRPFVPGQSGNIALETFDHCGGGWVGQFDGKGLGFIGFKFNNGSGDQYGWTRIEMQKGRNPNQNFKLLDYAYGDVGDSIAAGQKSGHAMVTGEGSLGLLALGAVGLLAWRKSRSQAAQL
jgi:hypothetical protein